MLFLFRKPSKEQMEMFNDLLKMETLKVSDDGEISVSPSEIVKREEFIHAKLKVVAVIEGS